MCVYVCLVVACLVCTRVSVSRVFDCVYVYVRECVSAFGVFEYVFMCCVT